MTSYITKKITSKLLGETLDNKFGAKDPVFEYVPATRLDGKPSKKTKKQRRALPPGLSQHDAEVLTKVKRRAYRLDMSLFNFMGIRFGWSSVIGLFPFVGDFADCLLALMVVETAKQVEGGLPGSVLMHMYFWVLIDLVIGFAPFVGDLVDAAIKANARNAIILEDYLRAKGKKNLRQSGAPVPQVDPSDPVEFDRFQERTFTDDVRSPDGHRPQSSGVVEPPLPARPGQARVHDERRTGGGFFGLGSSKKSRPVDVEAGRGGRVIEKNQRGK
ncbi:hypothetical protein BX600DRAFT_79482 [Xylariales sp. PMI_506]|nr:hypothetical protein BX600DRAFT_79482 [Xylariales sp. PMI_506]